MRTMILHKLAFAFDRERNGLVFQGLLEDGYQFEVVFPIGHVSVQFEREATELGYCGQPLLGDIETVDGFLGAVDAMRGAAESVAVGTWRNFISGRVADMRSATPAIQAAARQPYARNPSNNYGYLDASVIDRWQLSNIELCSIIQAQYMAGIRYTNNPAARKPYTRTPANNVGYLDPGVIARWKLTPAEIQSIRDWQFRTDHPELANVIGRYAYEHREKGLLSKVADAAAGVATFAYKNTITKVAGQAVAAARAGVSIAKGGNVLKAVGGIVKSGDLKLAAQYAGTVPGVGTAVGALASGANAALSGKSLTEIAKAAAIGAIPGGPLAQAAASAVLNVAQKGVEGQNMVKSAAGELVNAAISMAPPATQGVIRAAALSAINGRNVLSAVQRAAIQAAIAQVSDASARAMLTEVASGRATASSLVTAAGGQLVGKVVASAPSGGVARMLNTAASVAPSTPHFPAIGAAGLAATHVANTYGNMMGATPTRSNVVALAKATAGLKVVTHPSNPHAGMMVAALKSVAVRAA